MIWEVSVALIAVAFTVLVIFLVKTLRVAEKSMDRATQTLQEMKVTIDDLSIEVKQAVHQANVITEDLHYKMGQVDPVLESVKNVGEVLNEVTLAAKQVSSSLIGKMKTRPERTETARRKQQVQQPSSEAQTSGWVKWVDIAASVWQKYRT